MTDEPPEQLEDAEDDAGEDDLLDPPPLPGPAGDEERRQSGGPPVGRRPVPTSRRSRTAGFVPVTTDATLRAEPDPGRLR